MVERTERRSRGGAGRVPPHNVEAEASLLGALLLSPDAIASVAELGVGPDDFYKPAHQFIYDAVRTLVSSGEPADAVTVADELRRAGVLEDIGGPGLLLDLQTATPAISNAGRYGRIVRGHRAAPPSHRGGRRDRRDRLRRARRRHQGPRRGREQGLPAGRPPGHRLDPPAVGAARRGLRRPAGRLRAGERAHRRGHRLPRPGRAAVGAAARHAEHRRRPPVDGQDGVRARRGDPRRHQRAACRCSSSRWRWVTRS